MNNDDSARLRPLLERLGEGGDAASKALLEHAYDRLRLLVRTIFHQDFPRLEGVHETSSIINETALQLIKALRHMRPTSAREFFSLASRHIRWVLIGFARRLDKDQQRRGALGASAEPLAPDGEPSDLAIWSEFHRYVDQLPDEEREVVNLIVYQGFTQTETAQLLEMPKKAIGRRWTRVRLKLKKSLPGWDGLCKERKVPFDA